MAGIASQLLEFPSEGQLSSEQYHGRVRNFLETITKLDDALVTQSDAEQDFLQILSPSVNSISYLYVLSLRVKSKTKVRGDTKTLLLQILSFLNTFDPIQMRYVGSSLSLVTETALKMASDLDMSSQMINPLLSAIFRLDPTAGTLTTNHIELLHICLSVRAYREALPLLETIIHSFPAARPTNIDGHYPCSPHTDSSNYITEQSGLSGKILTSDIHEYYLYGAMIYIGLQRWEDALLYLECVLISPSQGSPTVLQVEAYKKWVVVGLLIRGEALDPPRGINQTLWRTVKQCSSPYDSLTEIFQTGHLARLKAEINAGQKIWYEDGNTGLVQQLLFHMPRFFVLSLQSTYSAVPLASVAEWLSLSIDETHTFIEEMISQKGLNADIDLGGSVPVLRFYTNQNRGPLAKSESEYHAELLAQTKRTTTVAEYVKMSDRRLVLTKEYIEALRRRMRNKEENGGVMGDAMDDPSQPDEDIMMDDD